VICSSKIAPIRAASDRATRTSAARSTWPTSTTAEKSWRVYQEWDNYQDNNLEFSRADASR